MAVHGGQPGMTTATVGQHWGMSTADDLIAIERKAWEALSTSGKAAAAFYSDRLARDVIMLLPGDTVIDDRAAVVESMRGAPWDAYSLGDERVVELSPDAAVVAYRGRARRGGHDYAALFSSTYRREDGEWRLAVHQQTPI